MEKVKGLSGWSEKFVATGWSHAPGPSHTAPAIPEGSTADTTASPARLSDSGLFEPPPAPSAAPLQPPGALPPVEVKGDAESAASVAVGKHLAAIRALRERLSKVAGVALP